VSLSNVWVQTLADGLVRADQVVGIEAHQTPDVRGKPSRWLFDIVLSPPVGSGTREDWNVTVLHRTLIQTAEHPGSAPVTLARLLAQLDAISAAGIITVERESAADVASAPTEERLAADSSGIRIRFVPFPGPEPGHHTDSEYL
jgi:hypothetical protein